MATIKLKNGSGAPTTGDLVDKEVAIDLTNKRLYVRSSSSILEVGATPTSVTTGDVTATGTINFANLPTSSSGLNAGDLWNDGGTVKVV